MKRTMILVFVLFWTSTYAQVNKRAIEKEDITIVSTSLTELIGFVSKRVVKPIQVLPKIPAELGFPRSATNKDFYFPQYRIFKTPSSRTQERYEFVELERLTYISGSHLSLIQVTRLESGTNVTETRVVRLYNVYLRFTSGNELSFAANIIANHDGSNTATAFLYLSMIDNLIEINGQLQEALDFDPQ